jgi:hypothetical protein
MMCVVIMSKKREFLIKTFQEKYNLYKKLYTKSNIDEYTSLFNETIRRFFNAKTFDDYLQLNVDFFEDKIFNMDEMDGLFSAGPVRNNDPYGLMNLPSKYGKHMAVINKNGLYTIMSQPGLKIGEYKWKNNHIRDYGQRALISGICEREMGDYISYNMNKLNGVVVVKQKIVKSKIPGDLFTLMTNNDENCSKELIRFLDHDFLWDYFSLNEKLIRDITENYVYIHILNTTWGSNTIFRLLANLLKDM